MKYIVITGGVISGIGKGITSSSIGLLLSNCDYDVTAIKIDPYLNIDSGTMSPFEHGECYVLRDGSEVDLDLGNYERFLAINLNCDHSITTGKVYKNVIEKERNGQYLGKTVQIVPHVTNEIKEWIKRVSEFSEICLVEVGGTVGDIEIGPFIEALRQMSLDSDDSMCFVHVSPIVDHGEYKTKPIQHSLEKLRSFGINPNILVIRTPNALTTNVLEKLELFSGVSKDHIIQSINVPNIYYVPELFRKQNIITKICKVLNLPNLSPNLTDYYKILDHFDNCNNVVTLGIVGKYLGSPDTYLSIIRAVECAGIFLGTKIIINWINSDSYHNDELIKCNGFIIPGGFGSRSVSGKLDVIKYCRINKIPVLGICLGMQLMVIDCYNSIYSDGVSTEWDKCSALRDSGGIPLIHMLPGQTGKKGGTMRLGNYETILEPSKVYDLYKSRIIVERHRHRYEVNNKYIPDIEKSGLKFVGKCMMSDQILMEVVELDDHKYYVGCQYHPEFSSKYNNPNPLFVGLIKHMI